MSDARCNGEWLGVGSATVDGSGRVTKVDLNEVNTSDRCRKAAERILRLSLATPTSIRGASSGPVLMVKAAKTPLCLNEPPADVPGRLLSQAPFGEMNGSALLALSQWTFIPAYLDGKPTDALFNLTINFRLN